MSLDARPVVARRGRRLRTGLLLARAASRTSQVLLRRGGGVIGGRVLLAVAPDAPEELARGRQVVLVTGTNGKSTVTAMLARALGARGPVTTNADGANTLPGLTGTLSRSGAEQVVLETDEGWLPWAIRRLAPRAVVLLNLSRDQLHRNPEVHGVAAKWRAALELVPVVVANCDDPAVTWAATAAQRVVWVAGGSTWREDSLVCPACGELLQWEGREWSSSCGLRRPAPTPTGGVLPELHLPGQINRVNAETALTAAATLGVDPQQAAAAIGDLRQVAGRYGEFAVGDHTARLLLAKNPASWQETLRLVAEEGRPVALDFNADGVDGRDPSWLYDVDFTQLRGQPVTVSGRRGADLQVRLLVDEVPTLGQFGDVVTAIKRLPPGPVDVIGTYTAFQEAWRRLA